jgi:beta-glucosidase
MTTPISANDAHDHRFPGADDARLRAAAIVAGLGPEQCIALVCGRDMYATRDLPGLVPSVMMTDGPHGLRKQVGGSDHLGLANSVPATCFPVATVLASSWDVELLHEVGRALGRECRAQDVAMLLGPGLNMKRHPRGGRNFEYFSEDPVLAGYLGAAIVNGIQSEGVGACAKHFAANNQETSRMIVDALIDERTLREYYLRGFEIVVERSRPAAIMTAYNRINGTWCSDNGWLLRDVLRGEWGFDGLVVSDWGGTNDRVAALRAGMDLEMPGNGGAFTPEIVAALASGVLAEAQLRASATRVVELALRGDALRHRAAEPVDFDAHHALARRAAAAGTVLLTNDGLLPLGDTAGVALIGAFAAEPRYQGAGSSRVNPARLDTLRDALGVELPYAPGYDPATGETTAQLLAQAAAVAGTARRVVLVVGVPPRIETETRDRPTARLPHAMDELVATVCRANPRTVVVLVNGGSLELDWADLPAALLESYLGGQAAGSALAEVLLGEAEPGGRLAESLPFSVSDLPADANFPGLARQVQYRECQWIGYRFHDTFGVPARFPFGHGLGYTTWAFSDLGVRGEGTARTATVTVTNTGARAGTTVVQVYLRAIASVLPRPARELAGFARLRLAAGETAQVDVVLEPRVFALWDSAAGRWVVAGGRYEVLAGTSSVEIHDRALIDVASTDTVTPRPRVAGPIATDAEFAALLGRPIPAAEAARPFSRSSTVTELSASRLGRVLAALMRRRMEKMIPADDDGSLREIMENVVFGMPLRGLAAMGPGLTPAMLDRIIAALNGQWIRAIRGKPAAVRDRSRATANR